MDSFAEWTTSRLAAEVALDVVLKATIILGLAWLAAGVLRRASAATRHGVWSLALVVLLVLPVLSAGLPAWYVDLPDVVRSLLAPAGEAPGRAARPLLSERPERVDAPASPVAVERQGEGGFGRPGAAPPDAGRAAAPGTAPSPGWSWAAWLVLIWGAGALALLGRLALHVLRLRVIARHAEVLTDARRLAAVTRLAHRLGIRRRVRVLCSPAVSVAMTWGLRRPVVLLPYQARLWSEDRVQVVLLHELAHVKRCDYLIHLVTQVVRACYWFNPLVVLLQDEAASVRLEAVRGLGKIGVACAAPAVRLALRDRHPDVRAMAARVLDRL